MGFIRKVRWPSNRLGLFYHHDPALLYYSFLCSGLCIGQFLDVFTFKPSSFYSLYGFRNRGRTRDFLLQKVQTLKQLDSPRRFPTTISLFSSSRSASPGWLPTFVLSLMSITPPTGDSWYWSRPCSHSQSQPPSQSMRLRLKPTLPCREARYLSLEPFCSFSESWRCFSIPQFWTRYTYAHWGSSMGFT